LLSEGVVDKIIGAEVKISRRTDEEDRFSINPKVWEKAEEIEKFPLSNLIAYGFSRTDSAAKTLQEMENGKNQKIAVIARPCDTRAIIELAKIRQVNLDNLFIIALEEHGLVLDVSRGMRKVDEFEQSDIVKEKVTKDGLVFLLEDGSTKEMDFEISENCARCVRKEPKIADLSVSYIGVPIDSEDVILKVYSDKGDDVVEKSGIKTEELPDDIKEKHQTEMEELISSAKEQREKDLEEWRNLSQAEKIELLDKCTMCGMCIRACPVCYCVDCILQKKRKDKEIDNISYQLTRIAHVADRCVECGKCFNNCPMSLPLSLIFQSLNEQFQEKFQYQAGESADDTPFRSGKAIKEMELEKA
jgi:formate dehydrogenase subunit beta